MTITPYEALTLELEEDPSDLLAEIGYRVDVSHDIRGKDPSFIVYTAGTQASPIYSEAEFYPEDPDNYELADLVAEAAEYIRYLLNRA